MAASPGNVLKASAVALSLAALSSCTAPFSCPDGNWQRAGFRDALSGRGSGFVTAYAETCGGVIGDADRAAWRRGYADGVARYCTPRHAEWMGQNRASYNAGSCPAADRKRLKDAYYSGLSYREMVEDMREDFYRGVFWGF